MKAILLITLALCVPLCYATFGSGSSNSGFGQWRNIVSLAQVLDQNHYSLFPGDPPVNITIYNTIAVDGYKLERINSLGTHTSTHMSAPCHFIEESTGALCIDQLPPSAFVFSAALLDYSHLVQTLGSKANFSVSWKNITDYEKKVGQRIPKDSIVLLYTGFGAKYGTPAYADDAFPGLSADAVQQLYNQRSIKGLGSDTFGPDSSSDSDFSASYTSYLNGGITIENMNNLQALKGRRFGDLIVATPARLKDGSGYQTNVLAFLQ